MILTDPSARLVIAHRGASREFPENTLKAFAAALAEGADALELDVRCTSDGVPVVIHDVTLDRTTDGTGPVAQTALDALRHVDAGLGERVPTLEEVLQRFPQTPLLVEIKDGRASEPVAALLRQHGAAARVMLGAFEHAVLAPFAAPEFIRCASRPEVASVWVAVRLRLPRWFGAYQALSVPEWYGRLRVVDQRFVKLARRMGRAVHVWTVDSPVDAQRLWGWGVAGIVTNTPGWIRSTLDRPPDSSGAMRP